MKRKNRFMERDKNKSIIVKTIKIERENIY